MQDFELLRFTARGEENGNVVDVRRRGGDIRRVERKHGADLDWKVEILVCRAFRSRGNGKTKSGGEARGCGVLVSLLVVTVERRGAQWRDTGERRIV